MVVTGVDQSLLRLDRLSERLQIVVRGTNMGNDLSFGSCS